MCIHKNLVLAEAAAENCGNNNSWNEVKNDIVSGKYGNSEATIEVVQGIQGVQDTNKNVHILAQQTEGVFRNNKYTGPYQETLHVKSLKGFKKLVRNDHVLGVFEKDSRANGNKCLIIDCVCLDHDKNEYVDKNDTRVPELKKEDKDFIEVLKRKLNCHMYVVESNGSPRNGEIGSHNSYEKHYHVYFPLRNIKVNPDVNKLRNLIAEECVIEDIDGKPVSLIDSSQKSPLIYGTQYSDTAEYIIGDKFIDDIIDNYSITKHFQNYIEKIASKANKIEYNNDDPYKKDKLIMALKYISADCSYDKWCAIGMALKHEGVSFEEFNNWSQTGTKYKGEKDCLAHWKSFHDVDKPVTAGTVFYFAKQNPDCRMSFNSSYTTNKIAEKKLVEVYELSKKTIDVPENTITVHNITSYKDINNINFTNDFVYPDNALGVVLLTGELLKNVLRYSVQRDTIYGYNGKYWEIITDHGCDVLYMKIIVDILQCYHEQYCASADLDMKTSGKFLSLLNNAFNKQNIEKYITSEILISDKEQDKLDKKQYFATDEGIVDVTNEDTLLHPLSYNQKYMTTVYYPVKTSQGYSEEDQEKTMDILNKLLFKVFDNRSDMRLSNMKFTDKDITENILSWFRFVSNGLAGANGPLLQPIFFLTSKIGGTGKSVANRVLSSIFGQLVASGTSLSNIINPNSPSYRFAKSAIKNKFFVAVDELPENVEFNEDVLAQANKDPNTRTFDIEEKGINKYSVYNTFTFTVTSNNMPKQDVGNKNAYEDRMIVMFSAAKKIRGTNEGNEWEQNVWKQYINDKEAQKHLLVAAMYECARDSKYWNNSNKRFILEHNKNIQACNQIYFHDTKTDFEQFIEDRYEFVLDAKISLKSVFDSWKDLAEENELSPYTVNKKWFKNQFEKYYPTKVYIKRSTNNLEFIFGLTPKNNPKGSKTFDEKVMEQVKTKAINNTGDKENEQNFLQTEGRSNKAMVCNNDKHVLYKTSSNINRGYTGICESQVNNEKTGNRKMKNEEKHNEEWYNTYDPMAKFTDNYNDEEFCKEFDINPHEYD